MGADLLPVRPDQHVAWRGADAAQARFCWIGGREDDEPFHCRVPSPVLLAELDHHRGVFLSNTDPAPFHIHTIVGTRTPATTAGRRSSNTSGTR